MFESVWVLVGVACTTILAVLLAAERYSKKGSMIRKLPGPTRLPIIGNAHMVKPGGNAFYEQMLMSAVEFKDYPLYNISLFNHHVTILYRAEAIEQLLSSTKHLTKSQEYRFLHPWLGTGLLTSTGMKWTTRRKLLTPTFHFKILNDFLDVFNEQSAVMVDLLRDQHAGKGEFDIFNNITLCALDIICETAMGIQVDAQQQSESDYVKAIYMMSSLVHQRQLNPLIWSDTIYDLFSQGNQSKKCVEILHGMSTKVIQDRKSELAEQYGEALQGADTSTSINEAATIGKRARLAFLDMLLYAQRRDSQLTDEDIREEVDTFMFEGHDTTAAAVNWAIHLIGAHTQVQSRLHQEMDEIFGNSDRPVTMNDIAQMKYLSCVCKEALRLFPSVPYYAREIQKDTVICGYDIPAGNTAVVLTTALHMDPDVFPDPERFLPERFLPENCVNRHPYAYTPFSAGPRNCIGQKFAQNEEKVLLSAILRNFSIESMQDREELKPMSELILRPEKGIFVKLTDRRY